MAPTCALTEPAADVAGSTTEVMPEISSQRSAAEALLHSLLAARSECEAQSDRLNRADLYKAVTGRSSLDTAIASTKRMIEHLDARLAAATARVEVKAANVLRQNGRSGLHARA
ncbi:MAG: hypothetical protein SFZ24_05555 [Planctomycetota bacterium]|nr:hypothetical protein [Planctomycetota bacterium]